MNLWDYLFLFTDKECLYFLEVYKNNNNTVTMKFYYWYTTDNEILVQYLVLSIRIIKPNHYLIKVFEVNIYLCVNKFIIY